MIWTWNSQKKISLFSYLTFCLALTGCKLPDMNSQDPNALVEVSVAQIDQALSEELNKISGENIKVGNYVKYVRTYRTEINSKLELMLTKERRVKKVNWTDNPAYVVMDYDYKEYIGNKDSFSGDEVWEFKNDTPPQAMGEYSAFDDPEPEISFRYYNLRTKSRNMPLPEAAMDRPNCAGLSDCNILGIEVSYIRHVLKNGDILFRQEVSSIVSAEIPPLFIINNHNPAMANYPVYSECFRYTFEGVYVKECLTLNDLDKNQ